MKIGCIGFVITAMAIIVVAAGGTAAGGFGQIPVAVTWICRAAAIVGAVMFLVGGLRFVGRK